MFQKEAGKSVLAEFNLGCDVEHTQHVYRVYVATFLGFGGNMARQRYEDQLVNNTLAKNRLKKIIFHLYMKLLTTFSLCFLLLNNKQSLNIML